MGRFEVHTYTICQGWINCWQENDTQQTFNTVKDAQAEINDFFREIKVQISEGMRKVDEGYDSEDFRIFDRKQSIYL